MAALFGKLTTKIALRKAGLPSSFPDTSSLTGSSNTSKSTTPRDGADTSPFAGAQQAWQNLQVSKVLMSWQTPTPVAVEVAAAPKIGERAPRDGEGKVVVPGLDGRPCVVVFLRHTGCPFAEKTFIEARRLSNKHPRLQFILISHSSKTATDKWVSAIGGAWSMTIIIDQEREAYAAWGLGVSTTYHLLNPWTQIAMRKLGTEEGIWAREVVGNEGANRWVVGGAWGVDEVGTIRYGGASKTADDIPDLVEACKALGAY